MRRLSAILMIAALLAAFVPSATLAAKPVYQVDSVTISMTGGTQYDWYCQYDFSATVTYTAARRAVNLQIIDLALGSGGALLSWSPVALEADGSVTTTFTVAQNPNYSHVWRVALVDKKGAAISETVETTPAYATVATCPTTTGEISWYTAP